jgi:hypothetical protein
MRPYFHCAGEKTETKLKQFVETEKEIKNLVLEGITTQRHLEVNTGP